MSGPPLSRRRVAHRLWREPTRSAGSGRRGTCAPLRTRHVPESWESGRTGSVCAAHDRFFRSPTRGRAWESSSHMLAIGAVHGDFCPFSHMGSCWHRPRGSARFPGDCPAGNDRPGLYVSDKMWRHRPRAIRVSSLAHPPVDPSAGTAADHRRFDAPAHRGKLSGAPPAFRLLTSRGTRAGSPVRRGCTAFRERLEP